MLLEQILSKCEIHVDVDTHHIYCADVHRAYRLLENELRKQMATIDSIRMEVVAYFQDQTILDLFLSPFTQSDRHIESESYIMNDSCMKILLRLKPIQTQILSLLLNKIVEISIMGGGGLSDTMSSLSLGLLNHIRWCDVIYETSVLVRAILDVLPILLLSLQIEFITSFPGLSAEKEHELLVIRLLDVTKSSTELIPCVFEAIMNLSLPSHSLSLSLAIKHAVDLLCSAEVNYLPALVRFCLENATQANVDDILKDLRKYLSEFISLSTDAIEHELAANLSALSLIVGILKLSFYSKAVLFNAMSRHLADETADDVAPFDMWVLFTLGSCAKLKSKVLSLVAKLLSTSKISSTLLEQSLSKYSAPLEQIFASMLELAQGCLGSTRIGSSAAYLQSFGLKLYLQLYKEFKTGMKRQELVASLVSHAGSSSLTEVNGALESLLGMCNYDHETRFPREPVTIRSFLPFIKSLLDDLHRFTPSQNRTLFRILFKSTCHLAYDHNIARGNEFDDIMILLRKLCVSTDVKRRKISIIGLVHYLVQSDESDWVAVDSDCRRSFQHILRQTHEDAATRIFLMDEIYMAISHMTEKQQTVCSSFTSAVSEICQVHINTYIIEVTSQHGGVSKESDMRSVQTEHSLGLVNRHMHFVRLYSGFVEASKPLSCIPHLDLLAPSIKLTLLIDGANHPELTDLITLPLELPTDDSLDRSEDFASTARNSMCWSIKYAIDWLRELVNAFSIIALDPHRGAELRNHLVQRVNHIVELERLLIAQTARNIAFFDIICPADRSSKVLKKAKMDKDQSLTASVKIKNPKMEVNPTALEEFFNQSFLRPSDCKNAVVLGYAYEDSVLDYNEASQPLSTLSLRSTHRLIAHLNSNIFSTSFTKMGDMLLSTRTMSSLSKVLAWITSVLEACRDDAIVMDRDPEDAFPLLLAMCALLLQVLSSEQLVSEAVTYVHRHQEAEDDEIGRSSHTLPTLFSILCALQGQIDLTTLSTSGVGPLVEVSVCGVFEIITHIIPKLRDVNALDCVVKCVNTLNSLLEFVQMLPDFDGKSHFNELMKRHAAELSTLCDDAMRREWRDSINKRKYSTKDLLALVKLSIRWALHPTSRIETLVDEVLPELLQTRDRQGPTDAYPTLLASSFVLYFTGIFQSISERWKYCMELFHRGDSSGSNVLANMQSLVKSVLGLVDFTKVEDFEKKSILIAVLREGRKFIELFLQQGIKTISILYEDHQQECTKVVTTLQKATRQMHHINSHAKSMRNQTLAAEAPGLKRALEEFIYKIKDVLSASGIHFAQVGTLKNRNIDGTVKNDNNERCDTLFAVETLTIKKVKSTPKVKLARAFLKRAPKRQKLVIADEESDDECLKDKDFVLLDSDDDNENEGEMTERTAESVEGDALSAGSTDVGEDEDDLSEIEADSENEMNNDPYDYSDKENTHNESRAMKKKFSKFASGKGFKSGEIENFS